MSAALVKYDEARRALAEAHAVDEVKDIRDRAVAMEVYAKQAKDGELIAYATEIRRRAERRLGELMAEERKAGKLAKGGQPHQRKQKSTGSRKDPVAPTLADQGVGKALADRARKAAALPAGEFEAHIAQTVRAVVGAVTEDKAARQAAKRERRRERELELASKIVALPETKFGVIYADPPWKFEPYSADTGMDRAADNHYPTMDLGAIKALPVPAADDCVLFLWATTPMLPAALEVMGAWGFTCKSLLVWEKDRDGTGYWTRNRVELLLIGTRGNVPAPAPGEQPAQVIEAPRSRHSEKPAIFAEIIERLYPNVPKLEMFAREARAGWDVWGNEAPAAADGHRRIRGFSPAVGPPAPQRAGNAVDPQATADARKSVYTAIEAGMTDDPRKDGIPVFLQTQNRRSEGGAS